MLLLFAFNRNRYRQDGCAENWQDKLLLQQQVREESFQTGPRPQEFQMGSIMLEFIGDIARNFNNGLRTRPATTLAIIIATPSLALYAFSGNPYALAGLGVAVLLGTAGYLFRI